MPELELTDYTRIDEIDRAHAVAGFINESVYSSPKYKSLDIILDEFAPQNPVEQAELVLKAKACHEEAFIGAASHLEKIYNWNPDKSKNMTAEEFEELVTGFNKVHTKYERAEFVYNRMNDIYKHFEETDRLEGFVDERDKRHDFDEFKEIAHNLLWSGDLAISELTEAEKVYEKLVFELSMSSGVDSNNQYTQNIRYSYEDIEYWLRQVRDRARTELDAREVMKNQYIMYHAEPSSREHKDAKHSLSYAKVHKSIGRQEEWDTYVANVQSWHDKYDIPLDEPQQFVWYIPEVELQAPDMEPVHSREKLSAEKAADIVNLANKLTDFQARSLDASVASRLIGEGRADEVVDNFQVFAGDTSKVALELLSQKGVEYVLGSLPQFHSLDNIFLSTLLEEWDKAWEVAWDEGSENDDYKWPLGLYDPTEKMGYIVHNLNSFSEGALSAEMPFELVKRMGADRDHGGDSVYLVRNLMKKNDRFQSFDHLELAKHYAKEVRVPHHWSWHEMLAPVIKDLDLPDTPEAQKFVQEVEEVMRDDDADEYEDSEV